MRSEISSGVILVGQANERLKTLGRSRFTQDCLEPLLTLLLEEMEAQI